MAIKNVRIEEGCIACMLCVEVCPEVFELPDDVAVVKDGVDFSQYEDGIKESAEGCPVEVIQYTED